MKLKINRSYSEDDSDTKRCNSSLVTIFAVWNTTVGTSLLAMAWGLDKTGLVPGIFLNILMAGICLYTAYILLKINEKHGLSRENFDVSDLCRILLGRWAEIIAKIFSFVVLIGTNMVYWILMSNFLYNTIVFFHDYTVQIHTDTEASVQCPKEIMSANQTNVPYNTSNSTFYAVWDLYSTVPIFLALILFPVLNFKNPTFFMKFNSLGMVSVTYLIVFVAIKSINWGIHIDSWSDEFQIKSKFFILSGMLGISYFIHNMIITIMRQNRYQEHNGRDLTIAFGLVTFTFIFAGVAFYVSFPLKKSCIEDNLLNNFAKNDIMALIARILLFFQLFTVFPLLTYMLKNDVFSCINMIRGKQANEQFSYTKTILINGAIVIICIMVSCFMPNIGTLIRYTGALSGLVFIFVIPSLLDMESLRREGSRTKTTVFIHTVIIIFGIINLISQFLVQE